ncbi:glycosyltransferase [Phocaeicola dorei]|nr:glycosyltransferase [Phocaeicola dorei]
MIESSPIVTVLMPVYNAEKYLAEAINSILNQTFTNYELLIINDGSTDKSEEIILKYSDKRIRYIKNDKNIRLVATLNKGIELAKGKYIARMDADDISVPTRLEKQITLLENNEDIGVCGSFLYVFGENIRNYIAKKPLTDIGIKSALLVQNPLGHPNVTIRKSILIKHHIRYDERFYRMEDWGLWITLMNKCKYANIPEILLQYRYVNTSESRQNKKDDKHLKIRTELIKEYLSQNSINYNNNTASLIAAISNKDHLKKTIK